MSDRYPTERKQGHEPRSSKKEISRLTAARRDFLILAYLFFFFFNFPMDD